MVILTYNKFSSLIQKWSAREITCEGLTDLMTLNHKSHLKGLCTIHILIQSNKDMEKKPL